MIERVHPRFRPSGRTYAPIDSRVEVVSGPPEHVGKKGLVVRWKGLGRVQIRLDSGELLNTDSRHLKQESV